MHIKYNHEYIINAENIRIWFTPAFDGNFIVHVEGMTNTNPDSFHIAEPIKDLTVFENLLTCDLINGDKDLLDLDEMIAYPDGCGEES